MIHFSSFCDDVERRNLVRASKFNGLDFAEVDDLGVEATVYFFHDIVGLAPLEALTKRPYALQVIEIHCQRKVPIVAVTVFGSTAVRLQFSTPLPDGTYEVQVNHDRLANIDRAFDRAQFRFPIASGNLVDCAPEVCPPGPPSRPIEINYLAKDYPAIRQVLLDRMAKTLPQWRDRHVADVGMMLVELLAYRADQLSYFQDAVATEAYVNTARQRISLRRHLRLIDYRLHEGCNARAWTCLTVDEDRTLDPRDVYFETAPVPVDRIGDAATVGPPRPGQPFAPLIPIARKFLLQTSDLKHIGTLWQRLTAVYNNPSRSPLKTDADVLAEYLGNAILSEWAAYLRRIEPDRDIPNDLAEHILDLIAKYPAQWPKLFCRAANRTLTNWSWGEQVKEHWREIDEPTWKNWESIRPELNALRHAWQLAVQAIDDGRARQLRTQINRILLEELLPQDIAGTFHENGRIRLYQSLNELQFHTWGNRDCCLPKDAVSATLRDRWIGPAANDGDGDQPLRLRALERLSPGDVIFIEMVKDPASANSAKPNPPLGHPVRLTHVEFDFDPLCRTPIAHISWSRLDALPFAFPLSGLGPAPACAWVMDISVAYGNVLLVDHGKWERNERLGYVERVPPVLTCNGPNQTSEPRVEARRFRPKLKRASLTHRQEVEPGLAAAKCSRQDPRQALPQITLQQYPGRTDGKPLRSDGASMPAGKLLTMTLPANERMQLQQLISQRLGRVVQGPQSLSPDEARENLAAQPWLPQFDLLDSRDDDRSFVVEIDNHGYGRLRFGDGECGRRPAAGEIFDADYRTGNGIAGNVPAESIKIIKFVGPGIAAGMTVRNPLPAVGGTAAESAVQARRMSQGAWRVDLQRAVLAEDYERLVMIHFVDRVQQARAVIVPQGMTSLVRIAVDPQGAARPSRALLQDVRRRLEDFRRIGHDLEVEAPIYTPIEIVIQIRLACGYQRAHVEAAIRRRLGSGLLTEGTPAYFHPDRLSFGKQLVVSEITAETCRVVGVADAKVLRLCIRDLRPPIVSPFDPNAPPETEILDGFVRTPDEAIPELANLQLLFN